MASRFGDEEVVADKKPATVSRFGDDSVYQDEDESFLGSVGRQLMELPAGAVRASSKMADIAASPFIAAERQVRPYAQAMLRGEPMPDSARGAYRGTEPFSFREALPVAERGEFGGTGLGSQVMGSIGELIPETMAAVATGGASLARQVPLERTGTFINNLRQAGRELIRPESLQREIGLGSAAVAGMETGEELGGEGTGLIASFLAPITAQSVTGIAKAGANTFMNILEDAASFNKAALAISGLSDDAAAEILSRNMANENMTVRDVITKLEELGPSAIPADLNESFRATLRAASNLNPSLRGETKTRLYKRQEGQAERMRGEIDAVLDAPDITVNQAIDDVERIAQPQIQRLYKEAGETALEISPTVRGLLEGDSAAGRAQDEVQRRLADLRVDPERSVTNFDLINVTKQVLDDQISEAVRAGRRGEVQNLITVRNQLIADADKTMPTYRQARDLFAGKMAMQDAAKLGQLIRKIHPDDMADMVKTLSVAERKMFNIGAREALLRGIDDTNITADVVRRLFGKNGDVKKLRILFPNNDDFNRFQKSMRREAEFILTRNTAIGNSSTAGQAADVGTIKKMIQTVGSIFAGGPQAQGAAMANITEGLSQEAGSERYTAAMLRAGEILLGTGMDVNKVVRLLEKGDAIVLSKAIQEAFKIGGSPLATRFATQAGRTSILAQNTGEE